MQRKLADVDHVDFCQYSFTMHLRVADLCNLRSLNAEQFYANTVQEKVESRPSRVCVIERQTEGLQHNQRFSC